MPNIAFKDGAWPGAGNCFKSGTRSFYSDDSLVIRFDASGTCPDPATGTNTWSALR